MHYKRRSFYRGRQAVNCFEAAITYSVFDWSDEETFCPSVLRKRFLFFSETHKPKGVLLNGKYHYLTGKCGTKEVNEHIAGNFIALLMSTSLGMAGACYGNPDCTIENVEVECGETAARKRRETNEEEQNGQIPLTVTFTLQVPLPNNVNTNESFDLNRTSLQIANDILSALNKEDMTLNASGVVLVKDTSKPAEVRLVRFICDEGQVQSGATCGKF